MPGRKDYRRVGKIIVRAHLQPLVPYEAQPSLIQTRVTLFINGSNCGWRQVPVEDPKSPLIQDWQITSLRVRWKAVRGQPLTVRFAVGPDSDWIYGINISNWPEGYLAHDAAPVEVEIE